MAMNVLVGLSYVREDVDAGPALEEMVGVLRQTGNRMMQIVWLRQLAHRRRLEGDLDGAKRAVDEALEIVKEEGTPKRRSWVSTSSVAISMRPERTTREPYANFETGFAPPTLRDRSGRRHSA